MADLENVSNMCIMNNHFSCIDTTCACWCHDEDEDGEVIEDD